MVVLLLAQLIALARGVRINHDGVPDNEGTYMRMINTIYGPTEKPYSEFFSQKQSSAWRMYSEDYEEAWHIYHFMFYSDAALTVHSFFSI